MDVGASRLPAHALAAALAVFFLLALFTGGAAGQGSLSELQERMRALRSNLDATTARIEALTQRQAEVRDRIEAIDRRRAELVKEQKGLSKAAVARANMLYREGATGTLGVLLSSESFSDATELTGMLARIAADEEDVFVRLSRSKLELAALDSELAEKSDELSRTTSAFKVESAKLTAELESVSDDYRNLQQRLVAAREASGAATTEGSSAPVGISGPAPVVAVSDGATCPVAGPVSFVDSWGAPRSGGRSHEGVDLMAATGTPVVAIVSGTITLSSYGDSAGNWQILSGDDGHAYWYMHNDQNIVNGGHVGVGTQIATVGNTGNASGGAAHVHFEFHPGGGVPVNPYPLVASLC